MTAEIQFEEKVFHASTDGFVPLTSFADEIFELSADDLRSIFEPNDRFYSKYEKVRQGLRHNVRYATSKDGVVCEGGIFHEDLAAFIHRVRLSIYANNQAFDQALQEGREQSSNRVAPTGTRQLKILAAKTLKSLASLLRRLTGTTR